MYEEDCPIWISNIGQTLLNNYAEGMKCPLSPTKGDIFRVGLGIIAGEQDR